MNSNVTDFNELSRTAITKSNISISVQFNFIEIQFNFKLLRKEYNDELKNYIKKMSSVVVICHSSALLAHCMFTSSLPNTLVIVYMRLAKTVLYKVFKVYYLF